MKIPTELAKSSRDGLDLKSAQLLQQTRPQKKAQSNWLLPAPLTHPLARRAAVPASSAARLPPHASQWRPPCRAPASYVLASAGPPLWCSRRLRARPRAWARTWPLAVSDWYASAAQRPGPPMTGARRCRRGWRWRSRCFATPRSVPRRQVLTPPQRSPWVTS